MWNELLKTPTNSFFVQLFRYLFSGGVAFVIDKSLFLLTRYVFEWNKYLATTIGVIAGLIITYLLSITWIFTQRRLEKKWMELFIFTLIGVVGLLLMNLFMWFFSDLIGIEIDFISNLCATVLVTLWNFIAKKYILFTKKI